MGIDLEVTVIIIQIDVVHIVRLNVLRRIGTHIRCLTGTRGIHHRYDRPVIFRVLLQVISLAALHVVMEGISGGSLSPSGDRYPSSRESCPGRYPSPIRYPHTPERYREGHRPLGHGRYGEDHRHYNRYDLNDLIPPKIMTKKKLLYILL